MEKVSLNEFKDCIVDENNNIVAEKPRWFDRNSWKQGEQLVDSFNKKLNLANVSNQRELLLDFAGWLYENLDKEVEERIVDDYLNSK